MWCGGKLRARVFGDRGVKGVDRSVLISTSELRLPGTDDGGQAA